MRSMKKWVGFCAAAAMLAACGGGGNGGAEPAKPCTTTRIDDKVTITCPDGSTVEIHDGRNGADGMDGVNGQDGKDGVDGQNGVDGKDGVDGQNGVDGKDGVDGQDGTNGTSCTATVQSDGTKLISCTDGTSFVITDGVNGQDGQDGADGQDGQDGANGHNALVTLETEPAGANCENGGTAVHAGVDLNDDGVLDPNEITSTQYVCNAKAYELTIGFTGFSDIQSGLRSEVQINGRLYGVYDPATLVRWKIQVTDGNDQPVSGVQSYYATPADGPDHTTWTQYVETDANGETWFGPAAGFTVAQSGMTAVGGSTIPFSVLSPTSGARTMKLTLVKVDDGSTVGDASVSFTIAQGSTAMVFNGFDALSSTARGLVSVNARLATTYDPTALLRWRVTLTKDGAAAQNQDAYYPLPGEELQPHTTWTGSFSTDSNGVAWFGPAAGFTATQAGLQQPAGTTTPFSVQFAAGAYEFQLDLVDLATMTVVGTDTVSFTVP